MKTIDKIDDRLRHVENYIAQLTGSLKIIKILTTILCAIIASLSVYIITQVISLNNEVNTIETKTKDATGKIEKREKNAIEAIKRSKSGIDLPIGSVIAYTGPLFEADVKSKDTNKKSEELIKINNIRNNLKENGWIICDGRSLKDIEENKTIYSIINNRYGTGVNPNTGEKDGDFNIPDYRGMFLRGVDLKRGLDKEAINRIAHNYDNQSIIGAMIGSTQGHSTAKPKNAFKINNQTIDGWNNCYCSHIRSEEKCLDNSSHGIDHIDTSSNGNRTDRVSVNINVNSGGDKETRPVNVYVYWLIKIR